MLWNFLFGDWQGTLTLVVGGGLAVLALLYLPSAMKPYVVCLCLFIAGVLKVFSLGYSMAEDAAEARMKVTMARLNAENEKAVAAAALRAKAETEANIAEVRAQMDNQIEAQAANEAAYQRALEAIGAAGKEADERTPAVILNAIRGRK